MLVGYIELSTPVRHHEIQISHGIRGPTPYTSAARSNPPDAPFLWGKSMVVKFAVLAMVTKQPKTNPQNKEVPKNSEKLREMKKKTSLNICL